MIKKLALLVFSTCFLFLNAAAQLQKVQYLKNDGFHVSDPDRADYVRIFKVKDEGSAVYPVQEFYRSGNKKSIGYSNWPTEVNYEGQYIAFFENGKRKLSTTYAKGKIVDSVYSFYPNGRLYRVQAYHQQKDTTIIDLITLRDSTGTELVTNGNGTAILYDEDFNYITAKGNIKNGKYDGEWTGVIRRADTLNYKEVYADGKMLVGESSDGKGNVYHYTTSEVKPTYKGGEKAFYTYVLRQMRFPPDIARQNIQGTVQINYTISATGAISNVHAGQAAHPGLAEEGIRMIKTAKAWQPAVFKGRKVDMNFSMPISFTLGKQVIIRR